MSKAERMLTYSLLSLIMSKRVAWEPNLPFMMPNGGSLEYDADAASESFEAEPEDNIEDKDQLLSPAAAAGGKWGKGVINEDVGGCWGGGGGGAVLVTHVLHFGGESCCDE